MPMKKEDVFKSTRDHRKPPFLLLKERNNKANVPTKKVEGGRKAFLRLLSILDVCVVDSTGTQRLQSPQ